MNLILKLIIIFLVFSGIGIAVFLLQNKKETKNESKKNENNIEEKFLKYTELIDILKQEYEKAGILWNENSQIDSITTYGEEKLKEIFLDVLNSENTIHDKVKKVIKIYEEPLKFTPMPQVDIKLPKKFESIPFNLKALFREYKIEVSTENFEEKLKELLKKMYEKGLNKTKSKIRVRVEYLKELIEKGELSETKAQELLEFIKKDLED